MVHNVPAPGDLVVSRKMLLPGFDIKTFPFTVVSGKQFYYIVNLKNLEHRDRFVCGSAGNDWRQAAFFFIARGDLDPLRSPGGLFLKHRSLEMLAMCHTYAY